MKGGYTYKSVRMQYGLKKAYVAHNVWGGGKPGGHYRQQLASHVLAGGDGLLTHAHVAPGRLHRQALCCIASAPFLYTRCSFSVKRPSIASPSSFSKTIYNTAGARHAVLSHRVTTC